MVSVKARFELNLLVIFLLFLGVGIVIKGHPAWVIFGPLLTCVGAFLLMRIKCQKCHRPACLREWKTSLGRFQIWMSPPARCPRCDWPFDEVYQRKSQGGGKKAKKK